MEAFVQFLRLLGIDAALWSRRELIRARRVLLGTLGIAALAIVPPALLEPQIGFTAKVVWISAGMLAAASLTLWLSYYRTPFGIFVGAVATSPSVAAGEVGEGRRRGPVRATAEGAKAYVRFLGALLASESCAAFIALLPWHNRPLVAPVVLLATFTLITYALWQWREFTWWPRLVHGIAIAALVVSVAAVILPQTVGILAGYGGAADRGGVTFVQSITAFVRGDASPQQAFWALVALLAALQAVPYLFKDKVRPAVRRIGLLLVAALLVSWFTWSRGVTGAPPTVSWIPPSDIQTVPITKEWSPMVQVPPCTRGTVIASHPFRVKDAVAGKESDLFFPGQSTSRRGEGLPIHGKFHIAGEEGGVADVILEDRGKACVRKDRG